jgi:hypothetical protein
MTMSNWDDLAAAQARHASQKCMPQRIGARYLARRGVAVLFNNNPYKRFPLARAKEFEALVEKLKTLGIEKLGYGEYPKQGIDEGYTYAAIFRCDKEEARLVLKLARDLFATMIRLSDES